jgi:16S rRNA (cytosine1402-N4)-methyltransferase
LHKSVLLKEVLRWLEPDGKKIIVDGTVGFGGHARMILERPGFQGRLIGFDKDPFALKSCGEKLAAFAARIALVGDDFRSMGPRLKEMGVSEVDGILLDLGVSSLQLDEGARGFSFKNDGPLDMRMNPLDPLTAEEVVNTYSEKALLDILWTLGEERFARKIVRRILEARARQKIRTTAELASIVSEAAPASYRYGRIHPATRTFQALRMAVNDEIGALEMFLSGVMDFLGSGGRLVIVSFHSLEDRRVKQAFREWDKSGQGKILTKKPVMAALEETQDNPRSRSAKLRAFEKL